MLDFEADECLLDRDSQKKYGQIFQEADIYCLDCLRLQLRVTLRQWAWKD